MMERRTWRGWRWLKYFLSLDGYVERRKENFPLDKEEQKCYTPLVSEEQEVEVKNKRGGQ